MKQIKGSFILATIGWASLFFLLWGVLFDSIAKDWFTLSTGIFFFVVAFVASALNSRGNK